MGARFILDLNCAYCGNLNKDVWYAPTCNSYTFVCTKCEKHNFITSNFSAVKVEEVTTKETIDAFLMATNASWEGSWNKLELAMGLEAEKIRKLN